MMRPIVFMLATLATVALGAGLPDFPTRSMEIRMPKSQPKHPETYFCTPVKLDTENTNYIVGFKPKAEAKIAHHMLLFGCKTPGKEKPIFNCGDMAIRQPGLPSARSPCGAGNSEIVYAWAKNAPKLDLPQDVGFKVGGDSDIDWLVLQVHYADVSHIPEEGDDSGVELIYTNVPQPKSAGVLFLGSGGRIPDGGETHMEVACSIQEDREIHPFAFRVHTHDLGTAVSGWKVINKSQWSLIGKEDPQLPQMFYPVSNSSMTLHKDDTLAARCTMENHRGHAVWVGSTREDEMCNFYMMYWVEGNSNLNQKRCYSVGPPVYSWDGWFFGAGLSNIPNEAASKL